MLHKEFNELDNIAATLTTCDGTIREFTLAEILGLIIEVKAANGIDMEYDNEVIIRNEQEDGSIILNIIIDEPSNEEILRRNNEIQRALDIFYKKKLDCECRLFDKVFRVSFDIHRMIKNSGRFGKMLAFIYRREWKRRKNLVDM